MMTEECNPLCNDKLTQSDMEIYHLSNKLDMQMEDFENRIAEFERRKKFYLLCYCAIASCVGVLVGALVFLLMGVVYA